MKKLIESKRSYHNEFLEKRVISNHYEVEWIENGVLKTKFFSTREKAELFIKKLNDEKIS
ncbi:MAG: hypothetical protein Tp139SUR460282_31 [Prokaryotic dsDNA virus sp.]|jgi:hypothetical protein|nr:MAG: hypothetical protein Tp139SUR460282_31 [Prokaryotic dsDNA virus sp.]|tara:strand:+ start:640 stop:819 length:180 start_codon:yes stop_codon:yes gene_type:complete